MHPLSVYAFRSSVPDAEDLEVTKLAFQRICRRDRGWVNWKHPGASETVARALLEADFGLSWSSCKERQCLVPAVPRSANYLAWIQDLLLVATARVEPHMANTPSANQNSILEDNPLLLDIGTGASCILPLLGSRMVPPSWRFVGTDVDPIAIQHAENLVRRNGLLGRIAVRKVKEGTYLAGALVPSVDTMPGPVISVCNPPFFSTYEPSHHLPGTQEASLTTDEGRQGEREQHIEDIHNQPAKRRRLDLETSETVDVEFSGTCNEKSFAKGGEYAFFHDMLQEMLQENDAGQRLRERLSWASCMFGHKASIQRALDTLDGISRPVAVSSTWLVQGKKLRWAVAWSFQPHLVNMQAGALGKHGKHPANGAKNNALFTLGAARDRIERGPHKQHSGLHFQVPNVDNTDVWRRLDDFWQRQHGWSVNRVSANIGQTRPRYRASSSSQTPEPEILNLGLGERVILHREGVFGLLLAVVVNVENSIEGKPVSSVRVSVLLSAKGFESGTHDFLQSLRSDVLRQSRFWRRRALRNN